MKKILVWILSYSNRLVLRPAWFHLMLESMKTPVATGPNPCLHRIRKEKVTRVLCILISTIFFAQFNVYGLSAEFHDETYFDVPLDSETQFPAVYEVRQTTFGSQSYELYENASWLRLSRYSGTLSVPGSRDDIDLYVDARGLQPLQRYSTTVTIWSDDPEWSSAYYATVTIWTADHEPIISISPMSRDFGAVELGATSDTTFSVRNIGGGELSGLAIIQPPFFISSGGYYNLSSGQSQSVTVRFSPESEGNTSGSVLFSGGGGASAAVEGRGYLINPTNETPRILVHPHTNDFGSIPLNATSYREFAVKNIGGETLSGLAMADGPFSIISGASYNLARGENQMVRIGFSPGNEGVVSNSISFSGGGGLVVSVTGTGTPANTGGPTHPPGPTPQLVDYHRVREGLYGGRQRALFVENANPPTFGDIDADGDFDMLLGTEHGTIVYYRNDGSTNWTAWSLVSEEFEGINLESQVIPALADIDNDGDLDLFILESNSIKFFLNTGTSSEGAWILASDNYAGIDFGNYELTTIKLVDMDSDSDFDLFVGGLILDQDDSYTIFHFKNQGSSEVPVWQQVIDSPVAALTSNNTVHFDFADLDADGLKDFYIYRLEPWGGTSDLMHGDLLRFTNTGTSQQPTWSTNGAPVLHTSVYEVEERYLSFIDIDGDEDLDLYTDNLLLLNNQSSFTQSDVNYLDTFGGWWYTFADIDDDGDKDYFVAKRTVNNSSIKHYENKGSPFSTSWEFITDEFGGFRSRGVDMSPSLADIDSDGDLDLFLSLGDSTTGTVTFLRNVGDRKTPLFINETPFLFTTESGPPILKFADIDGDEDLDIFMGCMTNSIRFYDNVGGKYDPDWQLDSVDYVSDCGDWAVPELFDVDNDGDYDMFVGNRSGTIRYYRNDDIRLFDSILDNPVWQLVTTNYGSILNDKLEFEPIDTMYEGANPLFTDIDSDGDFDLFLGNQGGLHFYRHTDEHLSIDPRIKTVSEGSPIQFAELLNIPVESWSFVRNESGGSIDPVSGHYIAGYFDQTITNNFGGKCGTSIKTDDLEGVSTEIHITNKYSIASVQISVDISHPSIGDLVVKVISPTGKEVVLHNQSGGSSDDIFRVYQSNGGTEADGPGKPTDFIGENSGGTWTLTVLDMAGGDDGFVYPWSIFFTSLDDNGAFKSSVDVIKGSYELGNTTYEGRAYVNVIPSNSVASAGKAVIIAGGKSLGDPVWPVTLRLAKKAYNTLLLKGYAKDNIRFISYQTGLDIDGNGLDDDIYADSNLINAEVAFTEFSTDTEELFVYLVDHGIDVNGQGIMGLNSTESLPAATLDNWLDDLQDANSNLSITAVMDFCYAGSFIDELTYTGNTNRTVISSCSDAELTYFIAGGLVSFSDMFFSGVLQGMNVDSAFGLAREGMSYYQHAWMDDNNDGYFDKDSDGLHASEISIGPSFSVGYDMPTIGDITPNKKIKGDEVVTLWAKDLSSQNAISRVWCVIVPPVHSIGDYQDNPIIDLPEVDLTYNEGEQKYEADFQGFTEPGTYSIVFFAEDIWGGVSFPKQSYITQSRFDERLILVAGSAENIDAWSNTVYMAGNVYETFQSRLFSDDDIYLLSPDGSLDLDSDGDIDVDGPSTLSGLAHAITNWAGPADRLTCYFIGLGTNESLRLNDSELLVPDVLDGWLDHLQVSNITVNVMLEFDSSGSFIPSLLPPEDRERINIASTRINRKSLAENGGVVSFTQFFLSEIFQGKTIGSACFKARRAIRRASREVRQKVLIDDNGNGIPNEKNMDGQFALSNYVGSAFLTGSDAPLIGQVMPTLVVQTGSVATIWVFQVTDLEGISNVWCVVTPPEYEAEIELEEIELSFNPSSSRYEASYTNLNQQGYYTLTFYAMDALGEVSDPVQSELLSVAMDEYEMNDSFTNATYYWGPPQLHNFHSSNDVDWVKFYAVSDFFYDIETFHYGASNDTVLNIYYELADGSLSNIEANVDDSGFEDGELAGLDHPPNGWYYVEVSQISSNGWSPGSYDLGIYIPAGNGSHLVVIAGDILSGDPLPGSYVSATSTNDSRTDYFGDTNSLPLTNLEIQDYLVEVPIAPGYISHYHPTDPNGVNDPTSEAYGNPRKIEITGSEWAMTWFQFLPVIQANANVRDLYTGEWLENAKIVFTARSGGYEGIIYEGWPDRAEYQSNWFTLAEGDFPSDVVLRTLDYDLKLTKSGYNEYVIPNVITGAFPGAIFNLGNQYMSPVDADGDRISDFWTSNYFSDAVFSPTNDDDEDGQLNRDEYIAGTNPTDPASFFSVNMKTEESGGSPEFIIRWNPAPGRVYNVLWTPMLGGEFQSLETGIQYPQSSYTDIVHAAESSGYYRVVVMSSGYDEDGDGLPNNWEKQFNLAEALTDSDKDGFNNIAEFIAGTNPTNPAAFFSVTDNALSTTGGFVVEWISVPDRQYSVMWSRDLNQDFQLLETGLEHPQNSYTDTVHGADSQIYYKVNVQKK